MSDIPEIMQAVHFNGFGGAEVLQLKETNVPELTSGHVLIKVEAAGINRPDVLQRLGLYPSPPGHSERPGLEVSGGIVSLGEGCTRFKIGDKIMALVNGGGYAEYVACDKRSVLPIPAGLSMVEAAAIPETFFTVWHNVFERGGLKPGEWLLVHGGTSGIGTTTIQMARAFGSHVIATAGSANKCAAVLNLGADCAINYRDEDFVSVVKSVTKGKGADVILDMVGGDYIAKNLKCAAMDGRIVQIAYLQGSRVEIDLMPVMLKRLTFTGSTLRARTGEVKGAMARALEEKVWPLIEAGEIRPVIYKTFSLGDVVEAHRLMESSTHIGKIMLDVR